MSPRTKEQFQEIREQSRVKILMAALEVFAEKGYHSSSIGEIAKKAGVAKGSVYHYFESKEAVLQEVIVNGVTELEGIMKLVQSKASPKEQLETLVSLSFDSVRDRKDFWQLYFSLLTQLNLPKSLEQIMGPMITDMFTFITHLMEALGVENAAIEAKMLGATMDGAFLHYLMLGEEYPLKDVETSIIKKYINT
ncbi:TetR/AcrR family transcriptional regulator [Fulvivirga sp. 29W222]|uniref:TetR/AcrR family transcriptional regulator n=1 Tax=Fulvivirga marina TaxID=2494733 RepID=A0A937G2V6_9BACT|nr:TetR/AcrR family transcriptional regulator [Fulvivirga marina]MBL6449241.1 TetR/AcrR family transcriptional regulator [Fulvivirga marina]